MTGVTQSPPPNLCNSEVCNCFTFTSWNNGCRPSFNTIIRCYKGILEFTYKNQIPEYNYDAVSTADYSNKSSFAEK